MNTSIEWPSSRSNLRSREKLIRSLELQKHVKAKYTSPSPEKRTSFTSEVHTSAFAPGSASMSTHSSDQTGAGKRVEESEHLVYTHDSVGAVESTVLVAVEAHPQRRFQATVHYVQC